jgi:hypothetical protein
MTSCSRTCSCATSSRPQPPDSKAGAYEPAQLGQLLWILARRFCPGWRDHLAIVTPDTVVRWHRRSWRLFWRWRSHSQGGRPQLSPEMRGLITTMSRENRLLGTERLTSEPLQLGIVVSNRPARRLARGAARGTPRSVAKYYWYHHWSSALGGNGTWPAAWLPIRYPLS